MTVNPYAAKIELLRDAAELAEAHSRPVDARQLRATEALYILSAKDWDDANAHLQG